MIGIKSLAGLVLVVECKSGHVKVYLEEVVESIGFGVVVAL